MFFSPVHCGSGQVAISELAGTGQPSLAAGAPDVAAQWHPLRNTGTTPEDVTCGSDQKAWWLCREGKCGHEHEWQATTLSRTKLGRACPICSGRVPCICNSLLALHPAEVEAHWDWQHNAMQPSELKSRSSVRVHWICREHDEPFRWSARPADRFGRRQTGCPACAAAGKTMT